MLLSRPHPSADTEPKNVSAEAESEYWGWHLAFSASGTHVFGPIKLQTDGTNDQRKQQEASESARSEASVG